MTDPKPFALPHSLLLLLGLAAVTLFFAAVGLVCLAVLHRRKRILAPALGLLPLSYVLMEFFLGQQKALSTRGRLHAAVQLFFRSIPLWALILAMAGLLVVMALLWRRMLRERRDHLTPMSVKEAVDNLPVALCCFLPCGRIVLANTAMERLCQAVTGKALRSGEALRKALTEGTPRCRLADAEDARVLLLPNGEARTILFQQLDWEGEAMQAILAADVTEAWEKTQTLEKHKEALSDLNRRLAHYNREIVDLTIQSEILAARVRLHDAMGEILLTIKQLLLRGSEEAELEKLQQRLLRNISFLKDDSEGQAEDEYAVLLHAAGSLGVRIEVEGAPPEAKPLRELVAKGLHESLTNLLRHAHGDLLRLELRQEADGLTAIYSGNGAPPDGPIRETGGLRILRTMTEQLGGTMELSTDPTLRVTLKLPKEDPNAL